MAFDFLSGGSSSSSTDSRTASTDQGRATGGKESPLITDKAKAAAGKNAKFQESGAVDLTNSKGNKFGADFSGIKGNVSFTNTGIDADSAFANSTALAQTFSSTIKDIADKQSTVLENLLDKQSAPAQEAKATPTTPTAGTDTPETEEEAAKRKKILTAIGLGLGALLLWFLLKKK